MEPYLGLRDHVAHFFRGADERLNVLAPFVAAGLQDGHHCLCVVEDPDIPGLAARLEHLGADVHKAQATGQLMTITGASEPEAMVERFEQAAEYAQREGWPVVRIGGDMTWALGQMPSEVPVGRE